MLKQRCVACKNIVTWKDMLAPQLDNYFENYTNIICPHCGKKLVFNKYSRFTSMVLMCTTLGLMLALSDLPWIYGLLIIFCFVIFLGRPTERLLNVLLSPFFPFELNASDNSEN